MTKKKMVKRAKVPGLSPVLSWLRDEGAADFVNFRYIHLLSGSKDNTFCLKRVVLALSLLLFGTEIAVSTILLFLPPFPVAISILANATLLTGIMAMFANATIFKPLSKQSTLLWRSANTDHLTGLYSRAFMLQSLENEVAVAAKTGRAFAVIVIDADHFKKVNDTYGHPFGDHVLMTLAKILKANAREYDVVARYGGEEFIVVLPGASYREAEVVAERYRKMVEAKTIKGMEWNLTVSAGIAVWDPSWMTSVNDLIKLADGNLYAAKKSGRNCVVGLGGKISQK